jgi:CBS domain-containing protein
MGKEIRDVMTPSPKTMAATASAMDAARSMRENDIGDVIVLEDQRLLGILTDRDIVIRAVAQGRDPAKTSVRDICSRDIAVLSPTDSIAQAVGVMREKALRRLPVVEKDGRVIGIVSLGDLAVEQDRRSVLGEISAAPPNQ